jgi:hypothetical protein
MLIWERLKKLFVKERCIPVKVIISTKIFTKKFLIELAQFETKFVLPNRAPSQLINDDIHYPFCNRFLFYAARSPFAYTQPKLCQFVCGAMVRVFRGNSRGWPKCNSNTEYIQSKFVM